jgi:DNA mismatch repair ATPase MutS
MVLAEGCLVKLRQSGCRAIFSTHLHELCDKVPEMNAKDGSTIDLLSAELSDGKRTFRILRGVASRASDAVSIAKKYGLLG